MKRIIPFILSLALLTSCWDYTEIKDQTIMSGISVDKSADGVYSVGFEILPMPADDKSPIEPYVLSSEGKTIEEAVYNMSAKVSYLPYVSHAWLMLVSEDVARGGISDILDLITTHPDFYLATNFAVVRGEAAVEAYKCAAITSPILAHELSNGFETDSRSVGKTTPLAAFEVMQFAGEEHLCYTMPAVTLAYEGGDKVARNDGAAVFLDNKLAGFITADEAQFLNIANGKINETIIALPIDGKANDFKVRELYARYNVEWNDDGAPRVTLEVSLTASSKTMPDTYPFDEMERLVTDYCTDGLYRLMDTAKEMNCDFFRISHTLHRNHLARWRNISSDWQQIFAELDFNVDVDVQIID